MPTEPTITCPSCQNEIKLTESLAAPLIAATKQEYDQRMMQLKADFGKRELAVKAEEARLVKERQALNETLNARLKAEREKAAQEAARAERAMGEREAALVKEKESLDTVVAEKLRLERAKIVADEAKKAKLVYGSELDLKLKEVADLNDVLKERNERLAEARQAQAEFVRKSRELDDARGAMELTIQTKVQESLNVVRASAKREAEAELELKVLEKETLITGLKARIDDLQQKVEQGSQQLQGEALELHLEGLLTGKFLHDRIEPVPKGEHGGDILHRVNTPVGGKCGTILWETKRVKHWSDTWLPKLRNDQRSAKAEIAVIVSAALPKEVETFDQLDGVWIVHPRCILPVAVSLRHMLIEVNGVRQAGEGQQTKMEMIYQYLTGPRFRLRVQAIVEAFSTMAEDLMKEKKLALKQWAKREEQIHRVMEATVGMYGDLEAVAGKSLQEIEGLHQKLVEGEIAASAVSISE